jgi:hypothetical protein
MKKINFDLSYAKLYKSADMADKKFKQCVDKGIDIDKVKDNIRYMINYDVDSGKYYVIAKLNDVSHIMIQYLASKGYQVMM